MAIVNFAIGDIHGKAAMLDSLIDEIESDIARNYTTADDITLIFVGDYVDRGEDSKQVIERIMGYTDYPVVALYGNHEDMMVGSLLLGGPGQRSMLENWSIRSNGGTQTLMSYGFTQEEVQEAVRSNDIFKLRTGTIKKHLQWLAGLPITHETPLAIYVHACLDPDKPLDEQHPEICIWSRSQRFLSGEFDLGKPVVHGHTIQAQPARTGGRIGIDTGAFAGGRLTALVIDSEGREDFIQV